MAFEEGASAFLAGKSGGHAYECKLPGTYDTVRKIVNLYLLSAQC